MPEYFVTEFIASTEGAKNLKNNLGKSGAVSEVILLRKYKGDFNVYSVSVSEKHFQAKLPSLSMVPEEDKLKAYLITYGVFG